MAVAFQYIELTCRKCMTDSLATFVDPDPRVIIWRLTTVLLGSLLVDGVMLMLHVACLVGDGGTKFESGRLKHA